MTEPFEQRPICDYEGSTYRTDFWEGRGRAYEDGVERVALRAMLPTHGRRVVDLGAGFGRLADLYAGYDEVLLLDYSRSQLEYARERLGDGRFIYIAADLYRLPLATQAVDAAVMVRVLHHLADAPAVLAQIARIVRPEGAFVLEFANKRHLKNVLRYALRRGVNPFLREPYEFAPLHYDFHPTWVLARLREVGFLPQAQRAVSSLRAGPLKRLVPTGALVTLDRLLQRPTAGLALAPSQFVRSIHAGEQDADDVLPSRADLFRCPACGHEPLRAGSDDGLACPACGAHWPRINGVYVFKQGAVSSQMKNALWGIHSLK